MVKKFVSYLSASTIFKAYFTSILGVISGLLTQLLFIRELTRTVSTNDFSLYAFVFQIVSYISILQLGMDFAISREIAIGLSQKNYDLANYSYSYIKRFNGKGALVSLVSVLLLSMLSFMGILSPEAYNEKTVSVLILLFGFFQVLNFYLRPYSAALIGANFQNINNLNNVLVNIASTIVAYILLLNGAGLYSMPVSLLFWGFLNVFVLNHLVKLKCPWLEHKKLQPRKDLDKSFFGFGFKSAMGGIAWTIEATADVIILNAMGLINMVGIYVIWWRFPQMLFDLTTRLTTSSYPTLVASISSMSNRATTLLSKLLLIILGISFTVAVGIILWLPAFINIWVGSKYHYDNYHALCLLIAIVVFLRILGNCFGMFLLASGKVNLTSGLSWVQSALKILLGVILVKQFQLEGLMLASIVCSLLQVSVLGYYLLKKSHLSVKMMAITACMLLLSLIVSLYQVDAEVSLFKFIIGATITTVISVLLWMGIASSFGYRKLFFQR